jgi:hypothetical protein
MAMRRAFVTALIATGRVAYASGPLPAEGPCADTTHLPNPVYIQCGDTQTSLMLNLGRGLRANTTPITLIWVTAPSCNNIDLTYTGGKIGDGSAAGGGTTSKMSYVPSVAQDPTWQPSDGPATCDLAGPQTPDLTNSALYNTACNQMPPPANVNAAIGPKQAYVLAEPRGNAQLAITAEEAYFLFGFGPTILQAMGAAIEPWTDMNALYIRKLGTSTLLAWAANLGMSDAGKFKGNPQASSNAVVGQLEAPQNPPAAIGLLGAEVYDTLRDKLQVVAFRAYHQYAAYYPDSTATSRDKKNLRDGHYTVWSPTEWMDFVDGNQHPLNPNARYVLDLIDGLDTTDSGIAAPTTFDADAIVAKVGLVPDCAMRVKRDFEGGPLSLYTPAHSCTCKYESVVDVSTCATCDGSTPCATGTCRDGYCEEF